jgi:hypothetical protein
MKLPNLTLQRCKRLTVGFTVLAIAVAFRSLRLSEMAEFATDMV